MKNSMAVKTHDWKATFTAVHLKNVVGLIRKRGEYTAGTQALEWNVTFGGEQGVGTVTIKRIVK